MRNPRAWTRALWIWWVACSALLAWMWLQSVDSRCQSVVGARRAEMMAELRTLAAELAALQRLPEVLVASLRDDAARGSLDLEGLTTVRGQAEPYCHVWVVRRDGRPALAGDTAAPPAWMAGLMRPRVGEGVTVIRPLAPGLEAGRVDAEVPAGTPSSYFLVGARLAPDTYALCALDLDHVFGPWLAQHVARFGFGADATARRVADADAPTRFPDPGTHDRADAPGWTWRVKSFFPDDPQPFDSIDVDLDNGRLRDETVRGMIPSLLVGIVVMLSFGLTIRLAAAGLARELEVAEARKRFTALVSHELRTPLAAIRLNNEIVANHLVDDPEKIAQYHAIIADEAAKLERLVDNLLEMGRLERRAHAFRREPLDLEGIVREVVAAHAGVEVDLAPDLPRAIGDREAMLAVLSNLVQNALKYGGEPPQVRVATRREPGGVAVDVMDRGAGIPAAERSAIFEPYRRLDDAATEARRGVGLGLALVKGFMEGQQGTVQVRERPGGGSIFTVTLPAS